MREASAFGLGVVIAVILTGILTKEIRDQGYEAKALIEACEAELPRNQRCILAAEPEKKDETNTDNPA